MIVLNLQHLIIGIIKVIKQILHHILIIGKEDIQYHIIIQVVLLNLILYVHLLIINVLKTVNLKDQMLLIPK